MYHSPRRRSPKLKLRPLEPPPWTGSSSDERSSVALAKVKPHRHTDQESDAAISSAYPTVMKRPFDDPHDALCRAFNVLKTVDVPKVMTDALPPTLSMRVLPHHPHAHALTPTHVLLVLDSHYASLPSTHATLHPPLPPPLALPINADLFAQRFASDLRPPGAPPAPEPSWADAAHSQELTLPTIALCVPHPPSVPLLLLYGLGLFATFEPYPSSDGTHGVSASATTSMGTLAAYLLPTHTIEEFPSAAAMADVLAMGCSDAELRAHALFNGGMWGNVLALAPRDGRIVEVVRTAWNVTAEARKMRERWRRGGGGGAIAR
ncbi:uncharacterized protein LAESUDRAFT_75482 [Laetiporus sulphureus 93-53]|uniref:Uncharacterized protein n=1 Tax=Laetiporus sulphureus 93-53 TaxID=1314785 RepID=A0A165F0H1_9APHY|nr:uncharacterized protein LAESUDRAFT_75482 [Laetiporus sulphureus 93-53]KZT08105.1 hypothetical protein LAESUDRAFT_75482 [Laetiporus sulphureus 93-53]